MRLLLLLCLLSGSGTWTRTGAASSPRASGSGIPPHEQAARVARFVVHQVDWASMATVSTHDPVRGQPFSNTFSISDGAGPGPGSGVPYMYLTRMELSVQDLQVGPGTEPVQSR